MAVSVLADLAAGVAVAGLGCRGFEQQQPTGEFWVHSHGAGFLWRVIALQIAVQSSYRIVDLKCALGWNVIYSFYNLQVCGTQAGAQVVN